MPKRFYNFLIFIAVAVTVAVICLLLRPAELDISVTEAVDVIENVSAEEKEAETPPVAEIKNDVPHAENITVQQSQNNRQSVETPPQTIKYELKKVSEISIDSEPVKKEEIKKITTRAPPVKVEKKAEIPIIKNAEVAHVEKKSDEKTPVAEKIQQVKTVYVPGWVEDFTPDNHIGGIKTVDDWSCEGGVIFTPKTRFYLQEDKKNQSNTILVIESKKSSAVFACDLSNKVDLNETPILRWRWKVRKLPPFADGRLRQKDDQAVGIYIGTGSAFNQKSIAYRWETETPVNHWGKMVYSNVMNVRFLCMRNKNDKLDVWYEECRNVRDDFMEKFGFVPEKFALVICGNSQNSKSEALAEIDYIGFYKEEFILPKKQ